MNSAASQLIAHHEYRNLPRPMLVEKSRTRQYKNNGVHCQPGHQKQVRSWLLRMIFNRKLLQCRRQQQGDQSWEFLKQLQKQIALVLKQPVTGPEYDLAEHGQKGDVKLMQVYHSSSYTCLCITSTHKDSTCSARNKYVCASKTPTRKTPGKNEG